MIKNETKINEGSTALYACVCVRTPIHLAEQATNLS